MKRNVMHLLLLSGFLIANLSSKAQSLYFPPTTGNTWDTLSPQSLNWCPDHINQLYNFLDTNNTKAFIILKDGKIVLEKYFGNFADTSIWYWASAGKSLTSFLVGLAQQEGDLHINDTVSDYLGHGWTNETPAQEEKITLKNLLEMTSGLDDSYDTDCNEDSCLIFKADAGSRWAYHSAAYSLLHSIIDSASGMSINGFTTTKLNHLIGMSGLFVELAANGEGTHHVFYSNARSMARFGLLMLNKGNWNGNQIMTDTAYFHDMINTSQSMNQSYGYLWWLNGKSEYMLPGVQFPISGSILPDAPDDMYMAMGKNGQFIDVVPGQNIVLIRMGETPTSSLISYQLNDSIWKYVNNLPCLPNSIEQNKVEGNSLQIAPNPSHNQILVNWKNNIGNRGTIQISNLLGQVVREIKVVAAQSETTIPISDLAPGMYLLKLKFPGSMASQKFVKN